MQFILDKSHQIDINKMQSFYDCDEFLSWAYYNIDYIFSEDGYNNYKKPIKEYCFQFDKFENWYHNKIKFGSSQIQMYYYKKIILQDCRWIAVVDDGRVIRTPNLPFLSEDEFQKCYDVREIFNAS